MEFDTRSVLVYNGEMTRRAADEDRYTVDPRTSCWVWKRLNRIGYGRLKVKGRLVLAHRYMYEQVMGPIPRGLVVDHLCRNRACANPAHLEPVPFRENQRRKLLTAEEHFALARLNQVAQRRFRLSGASSSSNEPIAEKCAECRMPKMDDFRAELLAKGYSRKSLAVCCCSLN